VSSLDFGTFFSINAASYIEKDRKMWSAV